MSCDSLLRGPRNADLQRTYAITSQGLPFDLTGWSALFNVYATPGATALLALSGSPTAGQSSIIISGASAGLVTLVVTEADMEALPLGSPVTSPSALCYDLLLTDTDAKTTRFTFGQFLVDPVGGGAWCQDQGDQLSLDVGSSAIQIDIFGGAPVIDGSTLTGADIGALAVANGAMDVLLSNIDASLGVTFTPSFQGGGHPGIVSDRQFVFGNLSPVITNVADWTFTGTYDGPGGAPGISQNNVRVLSVVNASNANDFWGFLSSVSSAATGGQNAAIYGQFISTSATAGPGAAAVFEAIENLPVNDPGQGLGGLEVDNRSNGTDALNNRYGINLVMVRFDLAGAHTEVGRAINLSTGSDTGTLIKTGITSDAGISINCFLDTSPANVNHSAIRLGENQLLAFDAGDINTLSYDGTGLIYNSGAQIIRLNKDGSIALADGAMVIKGTVSTGSATPALTGNKPGSTTGVASWAEIDVSGTAFVFPLWQKA